MLTKDAFEKFLVNLSGQSAENIRNYRRRLGWLLELGGDVADISKQEVDEWYQALKGHGYSSATLAGNCQATKAFFVWCVKGGLIHSSPASHLKTGSFVPCLVRLPNENEVMAVTELARQWLESGDVVRIRRATIWLYCLETGARLGGVYALRVRDVVKALESPTTQGTYRVPSMEKTGSVVHEFSPLVADALTAYLDIRAGNCPYLFVSAGGQRLAKGSLQSDFVALARYAGLKRPIYSHALRHRIGDILTELYSAKVASLKLNHKNIETTLLWYHRAKPDVVSQATLSMARPHGGEERI